MAVGQLAPAQAGSRPVGCQKSVCHANKLKVLDAVVDLQATEVDPPQ
jgi:hypothetical protein